MRYLTVRVEPTEGGSFHPVAARLRAEPSIRREAIHHVELLPDDTVLSFGEGSGDRDRYEAIMDDSPSVEEYLVTGDDRWLAVSRFEPSERTRRLLETGRRSELVVETPIGIDADGTLAVTFLGSESELQSVFQAVRETDLVGVEVVETGDYRPETSAFSRVLTDRQREVVRTAVDVGYYRAPREATLADVAAAMDLAPATVGEHLRKAERRVFETLVRDG